MLTLEEAKKINATMVQEHSLLLHAANVSAAMEALAEHFGEDPEHWAAVGWLHDYDYEKYPEEHLQHTEEPLRAAGVPEEDIRAILSHGYGIVNDIEPKTEMEKCLYTVDEMTGIIQAAARIRPHGIVDMPVKSFMKKFTGNGDLLKSRSPFFVKSEVGPNSPCIKSRLKQPLSHSPSGTYFGRWR